MSGASADARALLREIYSAALGAVDAQAAVARAITREGSTIRLAGSTASLLDPARCSVFAAGKAALGMARAWQEHAGAPRAGLAVAREPGALPAPWRTLLGGHPLPSEASAEAGRAAVEFVAGVRPDDTLIALLSGGASALLSAPLSGFSLAELRTTTDLLLRSGAEIGELNCVRKHVTLASGGRLARASPALSVSVLVISDVLGDDLGTIGSGPFAPDATTFSDAISVLRARSIWQAVPAALRGHLERGATGEIPETPKPGDPSFARVVHCVIASNSTALASAERAALERGIAVVRVERALRGEAREVGAEIAERALSLRGRARQLLIAGGETTVTVRGEGRGGRCQELALAAAIALQGQCGVTMLAAGTDGSDGPTDAAGAFADGETAERGSAARVDASGALARNDSYEFFAREGGLLKTGPTGTNALDLVLVLVEPRS